jgi:sugar phosphate isomerase/epimerase
MSHILCSTGAFSRDPDVTAPRDIIKKAKRIPCDGFELIFYPEWYNDIKAVTDEFQHAEVNWQALHTEKSIGPLLGTGSTDDAILALDRFRRNCEFAKALGISMLVLHLWGLPDSDTNISTNIKQLEEILRLVERFNLELTIETIPCINSTPLTHVRRIMSLFPSISLTLDTEFLAMHGELDAALEDSNIRSAIRHVHIKDFDGAMTNPDGSRRYLHPGEGSIDLTKFIHKVMQLEQRPSICLESTSVQPNGHVELATVVKDLGYLYSAISSFSSGTS